MWISTRQVNYRTSHYGCMLKMLIWWINDFRNFVKHCLFTYKSPSWMKRASLSLRAADAAQRPFTRVIPRDARNFVANPSFLLHTRLCLPFVDARRAALLHLAKGQDASGRYFPLIILIGSMEINWNWVFGFDFDKFLVFRISFYYVKKGILRTLFFKKILTSKKSKRKNFTVFIR